MTGAEGASRIVPPQFGQRFVSADAGPSISSIHPIHIIIIDRGPSMRLSTLLRVVSPVDE